MLLPDSENWFLCELKSNTFSSFIFIRRINIKSTQPFFKSSWCKCVYAKEAPLACGKHWFIFEHWHHRIVLSVFPAILMFAGQLELLAGQLTTPAFKRTKHYNLVKHINVCLNPDFFITRTPFTCNFSFFLRHYT